jgi:hypothetical protein
MAMASETLSRILRGGEPGIGALAANANFPRRGVDRPPATPIAFRHHVSRH